MSDNMLTLHVIAALALYNKRGIIEALAYLHKAGFTRDEALEIIALYDGHVDQLSKEQQVLPTSNVLPINDSVAKKQP